MLKFILPTEANKNDVLAFYQEFDLEHATCIGHANYKDFDHWLIGMHNRHTGENLPKGYVRENFYLCYEEDQMIGVFSLKFELTDFLLQHGGHVGYAVRPSKRNQGYATKMLQQGIEIAKEFGFSRFLCVCDEDNYASERVIQKNNNVLENRLYDSDEKVYVKRYWVSVE